MHCKSSAIQPNCSFKGIFLQEIFTQTYVIYDKNNWLRLKLIVHSVIILINHAVHKVRFWIFLLIVILCNQYVHEHHLNKEFFICVTKRFSFTLNQPISNLIWTLQFIFKKRQLKVWNLIFSLLNKCKFQEIHLNKKDHYSWIYIYIYILYIYIYI